MCVTPRGEVNIDFCRKIGRGKTRNFPELFGKRSGERERSKPSLE